MSRVNKVDSNITGARFCEETAVIGTLPAAASQVWYPIEPNSYADFGGTVTTVARNPINPSRQRKKGVVTDVEAGGGFNTDMTQKNLQRLLQGFVFASVREKTTTQPMNSAKVPITGVTGGNAYSAASGLPTFVANDLVVAQGMTNGANNGLKTVVTSTGTALTVSETLVADASAQTTGRVDRVGFKFASGDANINATVGAFPRLETTTKDLTTLGLIPGEWVFIGGDTGSTRFATAANNGFARVRSVAAGAITFDKTADIMVDETGTGLTIQLFFGRVLKNEQGTSVVRRSYQFERILGYSDTADTTKQQAEYLPGSIANEFTLTVPTAEKVTCDLSFVSQRLVTMNENVSGANTLLSKVASVSAPAIDEAAAFNTSSDVSRIKMSVVSNTDSCMTPLFAFVQDMTLTINNGATPNKAVGVIGGFDVSVGTFEVGGSLNVYFADTAAVDAVQNNSDITIDAHFVKENAGITFDIPLLALGDGRPQIEQDQPVILPLENAAADGSKVHSTLNHTLLFVFWDYLPNLAH